MSNATDPDLLVPRTCTVPDEKTGGRESRPLVNFRAAPAYVLLGDPGAGKTASFKHEAEATGGHYLRARNFAAFEPSAELSGKTLFIDGLDEMRAGGGDGRTPLDHVRRHLDRLGRPGFRLSCREADWYGDSDSAALKEVAPGRKVEVLHLDPLNDDDIALLLERKFGIADPAAFVEQADRHGLAELLRNPQTLGLLTNAFGGKDQPDSRAATYDLACRQLVREANDEHRSAKRMSAPTVDALLDAAGFLCAVHLLAGIAGFALDDAAADDQHALWRELLPPRDLPLPEALASGLFQRDDREQQRIPVHRSIAEYLGARYLAAQIESQGLPLGRVVALLAGNDGGIVPDLRGLAAWLAVHCRSARSELIAREPLGIVLYGDVRGFPLDDKRRVLAALRAEAERYANFRSQDWTAVPFGALSSPDMVLVFMELLGSPSRAEADIALLDCALDALRYGPSLAELAEDTSRLETLLDATLRDASYPSHIRHAALKILLRDLPRNATRLVAAAREIQAGTVEDKDDQLLGRLLTELFPSHIRPTEVFGFLHAEKQDRLIGDYRMFWGHHLPEIARADMLPELLDQMSQRGPTLHKSLDHLQAERMAGALLARALEIHGDTIDDARLYDWLSSGLDEYDHPRIDGEHKERVASWLTARAERYKAILREGATRCIGQDDVRYCLHGSAHRLYGAEPPADIVPWYLNQATTAEHGELARHFFEQAVLQLIRRDEQGWLTSDALDLLGAWIEAHQQFQDQLKPFIECDLETDWRKKEAVRKRERVKDREQRKEGWRSHFREHLDAIRDGSAHPQVLHKLAEAYLRGYLDIKGETPRERLTDFLGGDEELIDAACDGFRRSLSRDDLPSVAEIVDLEARGRMHFIRQPCLAGMEEQYAADPEAALHLDDAVLRKLLAFRLTWVAEKGAEWFMALVKSRPDLVAEVLVAYALPLWRKGHEHLHGIWELAYKDDYVDVARKALPDLLRGFPLRAKKQLLANALDPLLKAALRYLDRPALSALVAARLAQGSMSTAQRVYWLACGLLVSPAEYEMMLSRHIGASKALRGHLGAFLHDRERRPGFKSDLPESSLALLIELLAPDSPPEYMLGEGWVTPVMNTAEEVRGFIDMLGGKPSEAAARELERLAALPELAPWQNRLRHAAQAQRIARRKAEFRPPNVAEVCRTMANMQPANAADLAALTYDHLRDLAHKIRDGSTNDYRQFWSYDTNGKPDRPKPENDCRDILLSDLQERLGRLGVDARKEIYHADEKRADIGVFFGGAVVPIEIKKDSHADLWRAIREQLIERYARDPGADGFGIYLVFWFGGENMPLPQQGKKPRAAPELEERLRSTLTPEEGRRIRVCVIDCALP
ncbi:MAG: hypothetical protein QMD17_04375 [Rhodocyclaceae bacterium]|nr:hypothetical protein [Rhodocyclaceae bacterium]